MLLDTYKRHNITFVSGEGNYLFDQNGKKYLDMSAGLGVNSIGYAHPKWVQAVSAQAGKLAHISNFFYNEPSLKLAETIEEISGMNGVFFANSGAEAIEGLIKLAFKYSNDRYLGQRRKIATLNGGYHGRTIAALAATGQDRPDKEFCPSLSAFYHIPINGNIELQKDTMAVIVEPIQGAGGIIPVEADFVHELQKMCKEQDILFFVDEVQTGFGRTGDWFGFQHYGLEPDAIAFAKGLGGGLPIGGFATSARLSKVLSSGSHDSTFGGNALCAAGALAAIEIIKELIPDIKVKGERIKSILANKFGNSRGIGYMIGATLGEKLDDVIAQLLEMGVVPLPANGGTLRLLPPLTIEKKDIDLFEDALNRV